MNAIISYYFHSQRYEREYVNIINVENEMIHATPNAIHATHHSHDLDTHLEVRCKTPHFTAVLIALHLFCKLE